MSNSEPSDALTQAIRTARALLSVGHPLETVLQNPLIPAEHAPAVRLELTRSEAPLPNTARILSSSTLDGEWFLTADRAGWYYWPMLREFLISRRHWPPRSVKSLDESTDRILRYLGNPAGPDFDIRGLVLGYVQSGKTANYTALVAKAADCGYRLMVVLSGMDNGLRRQTNRRLKRELVGYSDNRAGAVPLPPIGQQWHEFTRPEIDGDFQPGYANHAALQGSQPVLIVVKKNGPVLRRLIAWIKRAPDEVRRTLPTLVIDDEADQASPDTRGSLQHDGDDPGPDYEPPAAINGLIRDLLQEFRRRAYLGYTATPYANVLIPADASDPNHGADLYPKDFIVDLPKPEGYFGAEAIFGRLDAATGEQMDGLDIIRDVPLSDLQILQAQQVPQSLENAILDFALSGAARAQRGHEREPATMLIHTSQRIAVQSNLHALVAARFSEIRDDWRYQRHLGIRDILQQRWDSEFVPLTASRHPQLPASFTEIEPYVGAFLEAVQVKEVNSATGDLLDYEQEPSLKAIAIGGNRLARGLTLEGLTVSYFIRRAAAYDTLMQMGRWFGFRAGYEDLTRIYTTSELASWFFDLAQVEHRLRADIQTYEDQNLTPREAGIRILQHPILQVTSPLKQRFASAITLSRSYSLSLEQTFKFPLNRPADLAALALANLSACLDFIARLGPPDSRLSSDRGPAWANVSAEPVLSFFGAYRTDDEATSLSIPLVRGYIERAITTGELTRWTVAICGRKTHSDQLGYADWAQVNGARVSQISRTRVGSTESLGVITSPEDELIGTPGEILARALQAAQQSTNGGKAMSLGAAARALRPASDGVLLLYPISKNSGQAMDRVTSRRKLFEDPGDPLAHDLIGIAISFPRSEQAQPQEAYVHGSVPPFQSTDAMHGDES